MIPQTTRMTGLAAMLALAATVSLPMSGRATDHNPDHTFLSKYMNTDGVPTLAQGASGEPTVDIQLFLAQTGDYTGPIDGLYGIKSAQAVAKFQTRNGLAPDGVVGIQTWQKILDVHSNLETQAQEVSL